MQPGVEVSVVWSDQDLIEVEFRASNGRFAGVVNVYADHDALSRFTKELRGFPASVADRRPYQFGNFDPSFAGGGMRMEFRCLDRSGHAVVEMQLRTDPRHQAGREETASFAVRIEAAGVDAFVEELASVGSRNGRSVRLPAAA